MELVADVWRLERILSASAFDEVVVQVAFTGNLLTDRSYIEDPKKGRSPR